MLALFAAVVLAAPVNPWLTEARALVDELKFAEAIERLEVAVQVKGLARDERRDAYELLAYCQVAEGRRAEAVKSFATLLAEDPQAEPSSQAPKVLEVFDEAKRAVFPPGYVQLEERPSAAGLARFSLIDPWKQVTSVVARERHDGGPWTERALTSEDGLYRFEQRVGRGERVEWYVEARAQDTVVATLATEATPRVVQGAEVEPLAPLPPQPEGVKGRRVAGWVLAGVGVAALGVATGLAVNGWSLRQAARDPSQPPGDAARTAREAEAEGVRQQTWSTGLFIGGGIVAATGLVLTW